MVCGADTILTLTSFFFNDAATTEIYTLSLPDALPILGIPVKAKGHAPTDWVLPVRKDESLAEFVHKFFFFPNCYDLADRKCTRLNSSHANISYAVFSLKKNLDHHVARRILEHSHPRRA